MRKIWQQTQEKSGRERVRAVTMVRGIKRGGVNHTQIMTF